MPRARGTTSHEKVWNIALFHSKDKAWAEKDMTEKALEAYNAGAGKGYIKILEEKQYLDRLHRI